MRDAISFARTARPAIALVTSEFWQQGDFVARAVGMADVPRVQLPHPIAGAGAAVMEQAAAAIAGKLVSTLWSAQPGSAK